MPIDPSVLIPYFAQTYLAAQRALDKADRQAALRAYQQLLDIYRQMEAADVEGIHRELAHDQLSQLYESLTKPAVEVTSSVTQQPQQEAPVETAPSTAPYKPVAEPITITEPPASRFSSREILLISIFVALIGVVVFVKPEFIGLATLDNAVSIPVDTTFTENGIFNVKLGTIPTSLRITGGVAGAGSARVYYVGNDGKRLVFDSALSDVTARKGMRYFSDSCIDSCSIKGTPDVTLEVHVENAVLTINSLSYGTREIVNHPPQWVSSTSQLTVSRNTPTSIDLAGLFVDPDGDTLGFIATNTQGLDVQVQESLVTFTADAQGSYAVTLIASDGQVVTRVPFTINAQ